MDGPRTLNGAILEYLFEEIPQPNISVRLAGYPIEILEVEKQHMVKMARIMPHLYRDDSEYERIEKKAADGTMLFR